MSHRRIGFIGFGEVASIFARALHERGRCEVSAFDACLRTDADRARLQDRAGNTPVRFVTLAELVMGSEVILSTVTTTAAVPAAKAAASHLATGQTYVDLNSTAPKTKQEIADLVQPTGAHFVEGAILSAVGVSGANAKILIGDTAGPVAAEPLSQCGLNAVFYSAEIGRASAFKLLRSIFSKGLEALLIEFLVAGRRAGLQDELWREAVDTMAQHGFEKAAANWIQSHASAHPRRYHEVRQVVGAVQDLGLDPVMTAATLEVFRRSCASSLAQSEAGRPATIDSVIAALEREAHAEPRAAVSLPSPTA
jgi:3-hydroxyisobutyrate dehydrogenase-like beta-hydroxyacid dehydrogenase